MQNSQNRILVAFIIVAVIFGGVYLSGRQKVTDAVEQLELEYSDFSMDRFQLIPPEIDLTLTYTVSNPSDIPLEISMDGAVYYGETKITSVIVEEHLIPAMGQGTIDAEISLNSTLLQAVGDPENEGNYSLKGTLSATGQYLGVMPVSVELDLEELESEE
jgi:hypothetical protein